ncbi:MAG: hypothetical protein KAY96_02370 [Bacteroidia bacterium]|nr:hypothetical protein [Bacteroidia bacterium]
MKIPRLFFGTGKEVHARSKRFLAKVIKEGHFPEFQDSELMDTDELAGEKAQPLVMFLADPRRSSEDHFRAYVFENYSPIRGGEWLWQDVFTIFDGLVKTDWGLLCLLAVSICVPSVSRDPQRNRLFFERLLEAWPRFLEQRDLFYDQGMINYGGAYFWQNAGSGLWPILVKAGGVPAEVVTHAFETNRDDNLVPELIRKYALV